MGINILKLFSSNREFIGPEITAFIKVFASCA